MPCKVDVAPLCGFVAAGEQQEQNAADLLEIDAIARAEVETKFAHALADGLDVTVCAICGSLDTAVDAGFDVVVLQSGKPFGVVV